MRDYEDLERVHVPYMAVVVSIHGASLCLCMIQGLILRLYVACRVERRERPLILGKIRSLKFTTPLTAMVSSSEFHSLLFSCLYRVSASRVWHRSTFLSFVYQSRT